MSTRSEAHAAAPRPDTTRAHAHHRLSGHAAGPPDAPFPRLLAWLLLLGGLVGAAAALVLTVEKLALLRDAAYVPTCSLNPVLNCGSVMRTEQAEVFGFPNPLIGLLAFPVLAAVGAGLLAGAGYRAWFWAGLQVGVTAGMAFVGWLVFQSLYRIGALCPYCMVVWVAVIAAFWYVTLANLTGTLGTQPSSRGGRVVRGLVANHAVILTAAYVLIAALITHRFWDYWSSLIS